jgi:hypothetical protein
MPFIRRGGVPAAELRRREIEARAAESASD